MAWPGLKDHGKASSRHHEKTVLVSTFGPEELHHLNLSIDGELFDGSEALWRHTENLQVVHLGQDKIQVVPRRKVTWKWKKKMLPFSLSAI